MDKKKTNNFILKNRKISLFFTFIVTIIIAGLIAYYGADFIYWLCIEDEDNIIFRGLIYSLPPLPVFFILWFYRHHDTQENLAKQQQIIYQNALFEAQRLILEPDNAKKSVAIAQLKELSDNVPEFKDNIYIALKEGLQKDAEWTNPRKLRANLSGMNLSGIDLQGAILYEADLQGANLQKADLQGANLQKADLQQANLRGADLYETDLQKADLRGADLQGAILYEADLQGADLQQANLQGADLQQANFQGADLRKAIYDDDTHFPYKLSRLYDSTDTGKETLKQYLKNEHGMIHIDDIFRE